MIIDAETALAEGRELLGRFADAGLEARLMGGVAVLAAADGRLPDPLRRPYADIDLVVPAGEGRAAAALLEEAGYEPLKRFNATNGDRRLIFEAGARGSHLDVFVGEFKMCHAVPLERAFAIPGATVPLAELLLTKLQVVRVNRKDLQDLWAMLLGHELGTDPAATIEPDVVAALLATDWGLWRTARGTSEAVRERLSEEEEGLGEAEHAAIRERLDAIWEAVEVAPKSFRWRARARVGERTRWYEEPDEVEPGAGA